MSKNIFIKLLICCIFIHIISISFLMPTTYALGDIFSEGKAFLEKGKAIDDTINTTELEKTSDYIYNALLGFAIMVAIIVAMVLGIQFMWASADEKAKVKEAMMPFLVGCIVVFGSFSIWKTVVNIGNDAENRVGVIVVQYATHCVNCGEEVGNGSVYCPVCNTNINNPDHINGGGGVHIYCQFCGDQISNWEWNYGKCNNCNHRTLANYCTACSQKNTNGNLSCTNCKNNLFVISVFDYCPDCGDVIIAEEIDNNKCSSCKSKFNL